jgi:hypothetical protein
MRNVDFPEPEGPIIAVMVCSGKLTVVSFKIFLPL